jgi:hypothetical protein
MIGAFNPIDFAQNWDGFVIQGVVTPGRCEVTGFKRAVDWDVKVGKGTAGGTETVKGLPPAKGSVKFYAWEAAHFDAWNELLPQLKYDPTKNTKQANEVYYPSLADIDVNSVNIESISIWEHAGGQLYVRTIEMLEFYPPPAKTVTATPSGSKGGTPDAKTGTAPDPAVVAMQKQVADLAGQAQKAYNP